MNVDSPICESVVSSDGRSFNELTVQQVRHGLMRDLRINNVWIAGASIGDIRAALGRDRHQSMYHVRAWQIGGIRFDELQVGNDRSPTNVLMVNGKTAFADDSNVYAPTAFAWSVLTGVWYSGRYESLRPVYQSTQPVTFLDVLPDTKPGVFFHLHEHIEIVEKIVVTPESEDGIQVGHFCAALQRRLARGTVPSQDKSWW